MTRDDFIRRWKCHVAGMALFGYVSDRKDDAQTRAMKIYDIPGEVERLLGKMYDDMAKPEPAQNGQPLVRK